MSTASWTRSYSCAIFRTIARAAFLTVLTAMLVLVVAQAANAEPDSFLRGDGHDGAVTFSAAGTNYPNTVAEVSGALPAGATSVTFANKLSGSGTGAVDFATDRLVMIYQSNGAVGTPVSGNQTALALSSSTAGHWEFARVSSATSSTLTLTNPLIYSYASGTAQVIAVPEWSALTVSNAGANILARPWDGAKGGVLAVLVSGTVNFTAAGTFGASSNGFRGGQTRVDNVPETKGCLGTVLDGAAAGDPLSSKGEGFHAAGYTSGTPTTGAQIGRGNYQNGGGGANCFNSSGAGGGNRGQGGKGGESLNDTDGDRDVGGYGGSALTYAQHAIMPFGGGGGAGERDDANTSSGGNGGGVVLLRANQLSGSGNFTANGAAGVAGNAVSEPFDGAGGGGAGGSVVMRFSSTANCGNATANGGAGGNNNRTGSFFAGYQYWSPGGGGAGGSVYFQGSSITCTRAANGGAAGTANNNSTYLATAGGAGAATSNANAMSAVTLTLAAPVNGSTTNNNTPTASGTATANSQVTVLVDGTVSGTATTNGAGNWSYAIPSALSDGSHTVRAYATGTDAANLGLQSTVSSSTITVDTTAPGAPSITTPAAATTYSSTTAVTIAGTAEANSTVRIYDGVTLIATVTANGSGNWTYGATLAVGSHTITATATDAAGNTGSASGAKTVIVDTTAPSVTLTAPANNAFYNTTTPALSFSVSDTNPGANSQCSIDSGAWTNCTSGSNLSALIQGSHTIQVRNIDLAGNTGTSATHTFTVDTVAPDAPVITTPAGSPAYSSSTAVTIAGTAEPNSTVTLYDGASPLTTVTANGSGNWTYNATLAEGTHPITAWATDQAGNTSVASSTKAIVVDLTAPAAPNITTPVASPYYTSDTTPTVGGTAEAGSTVRVYDGVTLVGTTTADGSGNWSLDTSVLSAASHTITATATDAAGNLSPASGSKTIVVDTTAPNAPTITTPATSPYYTNDTTPAVGGTAEANSTVNVYDGVTLVGTTTADGSGNWSLSTSVLSETSHTITATATDAAGNISPASTSKTIIVDTTAPAAPQITTPSDNPHYSATTAVTIGGTAEPNASVALYDGGNPLATVTADGSGNWTYPATLAAGSHPITAWATDAAGNTSPASSTRDITVDPTAPAVSISAPVNGSSISNTAPNIVFSITETYPAGSAECQVDSAAWVTCASGFPLAVLDEGVHTFSVRLTDLAGNVGSASTTFTVDTTAPAAPTITSGPSGPVASTTAAFGFTGEPGGQFECYIDSPVDWQPCSSGVSYSSLGQGSHTFHVRQVDAAGNVGPESTRSFLVDTVGPPAPTVLGPSGTVGSTSASISFSDAESPVTYTCSLDGATASPCTSPQTLTGLADAPHSFTVIAYDALGNPSTPTTINWTVDSSLFTAEITSGPVGTVATTSNTFEFTASLTSGTSYFCKVDSGSFASCNSPFATGSLADGLHTFEVYAVNGSQTSPTVSGSWTVDTSGPSLNITGPAQDSTVAPNGTITFTTSDVGGTPQTTCSIDGAAPTVCGSPLPYSGLSDGPHYVTITSTDPVGNPTTVVRNFVVDATPPQTTIDSHPATATTSTSAAFTFSSSESPSTFECQLDNGSIVSCASPQNFSGLAEGQHVFYVRAIDQYGNVDQTPASFTWNIDLTAPVAPSINTPVADLVTNQTQQAVGGLAEANSTVNVYDGVTPIGTATADGSGNWSLSPAPTFTPGSHSLTATSTDAAGNISGASTVRTITIDTTNPVVSITSPTPNQLLAYNNPSIVFTVTDAHPGQTQCSIDGGSFVSCTSAWPTGTLDQGQHTVSVLATDAAGNQAADTIVFRVDTIAPNAPAITSPADNSTTNDQTPTVSGSAEPGSTVTVYEGLTPLCSTTADENGDWSCAPSGNLPPGDHTFTAKAVDEAGNESNASGEVDITIDVTSPNVQILSPASNAVLNTATPQVSFTATDASTLTVVCRVDGGSWTSCSSPWTTPSLNDGFHTVDVRATDAGGNVATASVTFETDTGAPTSSITGKPDSLDNDPTPTFDFEADDPNATFECRIDTGSWVPCNAPWIAPSQLDGPHTFEVRATDQHGNTENPAKSYSWTLDATAPLAPQVTSPADGSTVTDSTPLITGTAEPNSTVTVRIDGNVVGTAAADGSGNWSFTAAQLSEGSHSVSATAQDAAGNTSSTSSIVNFNVDTTPPNGNVTQLVGGGAGKSPTFNISSDDGTATIKCSLDGAVASACSSPYTPAGNLTPGTHTLIVTFTDTAGNSSQKTITFVIAGGGDPLPAACFAKGITITDLVPSGKKVTMRGFARLSYVGQTVTLRYKPQSSKVAATAVVQPDGSFVAVAKAPAKGLWLSRKSLYRATVGGESTQWTQLSRRVATASASYTGGKLTVKGVLTKPLFPKAKATVTARTGCDQPFKSVGTTKIKSNGTFSFTAPYAQETGVIFVKVAAVVSKGGTKPKPLRTYSYVIPVIVK